MHCGQLPAEEYRRSTAPIPLRLSAHRLFARRNVRHGGGRPHSMRSRVADVARWFGALSRQRLVPSICWMAANARRIARLIVGRGPAARHARWAIRTPAHAMAVVMLTGGLLVGLGSSMGVGHATPGSDRGRQHADCPVAMTCTQWCPGDSLMLGSASIRWDWTICHDWYQTYEGTVDIGNNVIYPWRGQPHVTTPAPAGGPFGRVPLSERCIPWSPFLDCGFL
ncbi:hypothetical protein ABIA30_001468 [Mycobacterium sp. MAA66]